VRLEVHLFATLGAYLPRDAQGDAVTLEIPDGSTVADVTRRLGIPRDAEVLAAINGQEADPGQLLRAGDVLTLFPPLAGGR
jgi:molybdopterin converting factor small subunit